MPRENADVALREDTKRNIRADLSVVLGDVETRAGRRLTMIERGTVIHEAGPLIDWVQRCTRCDYVISDYRNSAWPENQCQPTGFRAGAFVEVDDGGNPKFSGETTDDPNCSPKEG